MATKINNTAKAIFCMDYFSKNLPNPATELNYTEPFELLVAVILSAQCTDKRVNQITPALLKAFPSPEKMAGADIFEVFEYIKTCSYPNNKAKHLVEMAKVLTEKFHGTIPSDIQLLQQLPGVGRKTANVIASVIYNKPAMAVDTHVFRVSNRIGLANSKTPLGTEKQLLDIFPPEIIPKAHHWLILHGRYICVARKPKCPECGLQKICDYFKYANDKKNKIDELK